MTNNEYMDLKDYRVQPDEGLYGKIESRLRRRRMARVGAGVTAACTVVAGVLLALPGGKAEEAPQPMVAQVAEMSAVQQVVPQERQQGMPDVEVVAFKEVVPDCSVRPVPIAEKEAEVKATAEEPVRSTSEVDAIAQPIVSLSAPVKETVVVPQKTVAQKKATEPKAEEPQAEETPTTKSDPSTPPLHIDDLMWAPNVIVPDGDVEENRSFVLKFSSDVTDFQLFIYNRGGRQIYNTTDPSFAWDGTSHGTAMPQGAYVWVAKFRDSTGKMHQEKGTVTLLR